MFGSLVLMNSFDSTSGRCCKELLPKRKAGMEVWGMGIDHRDLYGMVMDIE